MAYIADHNIEGVRHSANEAQRSLRPHERLVSAHWVASHKPAQVGKAQRAHADTAPVAACGSSKPRPNRVGTPLWPLFTLRWLNQ